MKRGQITLFVIIGIIVIAVIGLGFYFKDVIVQETTTAQFAERAEVAPEVKDIYDQIFDCLEQTTKEGLTLVGLQGGYAQPPSDSILVPDEGISIAIGYDQGKNRLPSLLEIQDELESYVDTISPTCINLEAFEGFSFDIGTPKTSVQLLQDYVIFDISYPITANKGDAIYRLDKAYKFSYPVRFRRIYEISQDIVESESQDGSTMDINFLLDFGVDIDVLSFEANQVVYLLTDQESSIDDVPYIFMFGNRYEQ